MSTAAMFSIETVRSGDFNIVFIVGVFLKFGNQVMFESARVYEHSAGELSDKDATGGVFGGLFCIVFGAFYITQTIRVMSYTITIPK